MPPASRRCASGRASASAGTVFLITLGTGSGPRCSTTAGSSRTWSSGTWRSGAAMPSGGPPPWPASGAGISWKAWAADLDEHLAGDREADLAEPDHPRRRRVSKSADMFVPRLTVRGPVVPGAAAQRRGHHRRGDGRWRSRGRAASAEARRSAGVPRPAPRSADPATPDSIASLTRRAATATPGRAAPQRLRGARHDHALARVQRTRSPAGSAS